MANRVTFTQINNQVQTNIARNYAKLSDFQEKLSSGKRIQRPSDAPIDLSYDLYLRSEMKKKEQFKRNMEDGMSYLSVVESTIAGTNNLYQRARELAIQASNDTNTGTEREYINREIRVILDSMVSVANYSYKRGYVFSGTETKTPPYQLMQGKDVIDDQVTAGDSADTSLQIAGPLNASIQIWDRNITDSELVTNNPRGNAMTKDIIPGSLSITGLTEGVDYEVDYVKGTINFLDKETVTIPGVGDLTRAQIQAASPATWAGIWPAPGDPLWGGAAEQPQPGGGLEINYEWIRLSEKNFEGKIHREIDTALVDRINVTAAEVFGDSNEVTSWDAFIKLMEGLHKDQGSMIQESITHLNSSLERSLSAQAIVGSHTNRLERTISRNEESYIESNRLASFIEDVDFAEVISDFVLQESVYSASLQSGARIIQPSLADFL